MLVRVLADVPRILGIFQVAGLIQLHDLVIGAQSFVRVGDIGERNRGLFAGELLRLRDGIARPRDFALIAVENR